MKGYFITFEGSEGSGKSTQINLIHKYLKKREVPVVFVREPGGVKISEKIRNLLLDVKNEVMCQQSETLLYMAARAQLVCEIIEPALKKGEVVLCDRYLDSTVVYQGYGSGVDIDFIKTIGAFATRSITPDLTFIFDIDAKEGLSRINRAKDRIEQRNISYHNRVRKGYQELARLEPQRVKLLKGNDKKEDIQQQVCAHVSALLGLK